MPLIVKDKPTGDYEPLAAGMHHAVCYGVVDCGTQPPNDPKYKAKRKVAVLWEVPGERLQFEKDGVKKDLPRGISNIYTLSLNQKGNLRPMLESWRGKPFTEQELEGFDIGALVGANCFINVVHKKVGDKTYANVASVNPLPKGINKLKPENATVFFSLDDCQGAITVPESIPEWLKGKIMQSEECMKEQQAAGAPDVPQEEHGDQKLDEDVPF